MGAKTILVTGANGFLGTEVVRHLHNAGFPVRATDRVKVYMDDIEYYQADILNPPQIAEATKDIHTVIHAAGLAHVFSSEEKLAHRFHLINEVGATNVMKIAVDFGVKHFILISSVSVYGPSTQGMFQENDPCSPVEPYAISKYNAEQKVMELAGTSGMSVTILRLATLYGEGDPGNVNRLMRAIDKARFIWLGNGGNKKSLIYIGDAARAIMAVAKDPGVGVHVYNVSARPCLMREIVDGLGQALGRYPLPGRIPASLALSASHLLSKLPSARLRRLRGTIEKWLSEDVYDTRHFEDTFGYQTEVDLTEGLRREVAWYRQSELRTGSN